MAQPNELQKPLSASPETLVSDEGSFLSPAESGALLARLEEEDRKTLGGEEPSYRDEEGSFIAPEDIDAPYPERGVFAAAGPSAPAQSPRSTGPQADPRQSELLARIAGELRSIKSEIGFLKTTYDGMMEKASSIVENAAPPPRGGGGRLQAEAAAGQFIPEPILADLKKLFVYLDRLLESLPEDKVDDFARSEYFELYREVFEFLDLV